MKRALWNGEILAESDRTVELEGNEYFPPDSIRPEFFHESETRTQCPWKGTAHYYDVVVHGEINKDAAWFYPEPKEEAEKISGYLAFWHGIKVS